MKALQVGALLRQWDPHSDTEIPDTSSYKYVPLGRNSRCLIEIHKRSVDANECYGHAVDFDRFTFTILTHSIHTMP